MSLYWDVNVFVSWSKMRVNLMIRGVISRWKPECQWLCSSTPDKGQEPEANPTHSSTRFVETMTEALHRIPLLTAVEAEEWGAGWQVRGWAHGSSWMNCLPPGISPNLLRGMCNHDIAGKRVVTLNELLIGHSYKEFIPVCWKCQWWSIWHLIQESLYLI